MKKWPIVAGLLLALSVGFVGGRLSSPDADPGAPKAKDKDGNAASKKSDRLPSQTLQSLSGKLRQEVRKAPPDKLPAMVASVMETVDPILRRQLLYDLFERMDAGNFMEMTAEMDRTSLETGRDNYIEWLLIHTRAGQVAGADAMNRWDLNSGGKITEPAWRTLWGWSSNDPDAALQWLNGKENLNPIDRAKLLNAVASGAIMRDPAKAMELLASFNEEDKLRCVGQFTFDLVQNGGKESAIAWLQSVRASEPDSDFAKRVTTGVFDKMMSQSITQASAPTMAADLERLSAVMPVPETLIQRSLSQLRERKPVAGIDLLDRISTSPSFKDQPVSEQMWESTIVTALAKDRNSVADWLAKNSGSNSYQRVLAAYQQPMQTPPAGVPSGGH
jgi:hypothetical protein